MPSTILGSTNITMNWDKDGREREKEGWKEVRREEEDSHGVPEPETIKGPLCDF